MSETQHIETQRMEPGQVFVLSRRRAIRSLPSTAAEPGNQLKVMHPGEVLMLLTSPERDHERRCTWSLALHQSGTVGYILSDTLALVPVNARTQDAQ